jgi:hypothetical protein
MSVTYSEPGIFNVLDPWVNIAGVGYTGLVAGPLANPAQNTTVLQGIIELAQAFTAGGNCPDHAYGATILFPGHSVVPEPVDNTAGDPDLGADYFFSVPAGMPAAMFINCNWPLRFLGTGNVRLIMYIANPSDTSGDMFSILTAGTGPNADNTGGITFEDLTFNYQTSTPQTPPVTWAAIHTIPTTPGSNGGGAENVRLVRCAFEDCLIGVWFEVALQPSILQCTFIWSINVGIGIMLGDGANGKGAAKEVYIAGLVMTGGSTPPAGLTAIQIGGCDHARIENCQIDSVTYGIIITPGAGPGTPISAGMFTPPNAVHLSFTAVNVYVGTVLGGASSIGKGLSIQPATSQQNVAQVVFQGCTFEMGDQATPTTGGPGILVDGRNASTVDSVRFVSCYSCRWPGPGLAVQGGATNVEVLGGMFAGNKYGTITTQSYGIYLSDCTGVRVIGAACIGKYQFVKITGPPVSSPTQAVGIYVDSLASDVIIDGCDTRKSSDKGIYVNEGASDVIIDGCDVRNDNTNFGIVVDGTLGAVTRVFIRNCNATGYVHYYTAISVLGAVSNVSTVQITDCAGYNDQGALLHSLIPTSGVTFYSYTYGYFGPVEFYTAPQAATISSISVDGNITRLTMGSFLLVPGEDAAISWTPIGVFVPSFYMIGK